MSDKIEITMERVQKARAELILARRFYGVLVSNVEPVISRLVPTAGTDGKRHYWNPDYVEELDQDELVGVQGHESEHDARHHSTRRGSRDHKKWNEACDYAINLDLIAEGFKLPKGALYDKRFLGMSAEEIYRTRELDEQRKQPPPPPAEAPEADEDETEEGLENADTDPGTQPQDEGDDSDDDEAGDKPGDEDGAGDDEGEDGKGKGNGGDAESETEAEGEGGEGDGEGEGGEGGEGQGEGDAKDTGTNGKGGGEPSEGEEAEVKSSGDTGRCGEVLDAATDSTERAEEDIKWERVVRQAASMAKAVGQLPGHVSRDIERANNPPRDWRDELREFCEQGALRTETWNRPNRRLIGQGLVLPGTQRDGINKAAFLIDTSGSCDHIALACVQDEAQSLLDDGIIDEVVVVYGDTVVTRVDEYRTGDEIEFDPRGGGGTDMEPLFRHVAEEISDASLIINFTDLEFYKDCGEEPTVPVLFAVHGYPQRVQELMANAPWGARAIDVGVH
jgi:predicted metal-dependent peptidase